MIIYVYVIHERRGNIEFNMSDFGIQGKSLSRWKHLGQRAKKQHCT